MDDSRVIDLRERIGEVLARRGQARFVGTALPQAMISLDMLGMAAREYDLAAELAGEKSDGDWSAPPRAPAGRAR